MFPSLPAVFDPVAWWARVDGERTALIDASDDTRWSYRALDLEADRWHALLAQAGVRPGDRVAVLAPNRREYLPLFFGCLRLGAVLVPLNWRLSAPELARVLADARPVVCFGEDSVRALAEAALRAAALSEATRWHDFDREVPSLLARADRTPPASPVRTHDDATMLLYTSGSTGAPKGVVLPHRQLLWNAIATSTGWQLGAEDVGPIATPFFHTGGWHVFTTPLLFRGGTLVLLGAFDASAYLGTLARYGITVTFGVPTQLDLVQRAADWGRPLPRLRAFWSGGAPCPQRTKDAVRAAGYGFREGYGLTECGPNCFATNAVTARAQDGSVGWPVPFLEARVRTDEGTLALPDVIGELELRGPQMFGGYFNAPERTAEVMTADGFLRTGDLASCGADGVFRIRGRRKEMFISGGENVFPGEVEAALLDCAGVRDVAVLGVPDAVWGETGCALVVREHAHLDHEALVRDARARLAGYKVPKRVVFVDAIPRLGSGKIDRATARALVEAAEPGA
ncbi:MAG: acyl--CoA ligase [Gemmatimonadetes bacterium]|nr:acyl--CoA ligase [Gemmatimonadota bacterium]